MQARAATYGFVAELPMQIVGDRPEARSTSHECLGLRVLGDER